MLCSCSSLLGIRDAIGLYLHFRAFLVPRSQLSFKDDETLTWGFAERICSVPVSLKRVSEVESRRERRKARTNFSIVHIVQCLGSLGHGSGLDPRADLMVDGELEELVEFLGSSDQRSSQRNTLSDESVSVPAKVRSSQLRLVRHTNEEEERTWREASPQGDHREREFLRVEGA